ncbi:MAG: ABC transporter substrate-binding protein, partial [Roseburia sp.]|nr:ABC transporter substrate-binding protein [Roseburia sp.]
MKKQKRILLGLLLCMLFILSACGAKDKETAEEKVDFNSLSKTGTMELSYATQYSVDEYGDYKMITIVDGGRFLLVPEKKEVPSNLPEDVTVLQQP